MTTRKRRGGREIDLDAYAAWLQTDEAVEVFRASNEAADEDTEVFRRMLDLDFETWHTPITPVRR
jgi:hypothetical protein